MTDFPLCELHGSRIVSEFPPGCPTGLPGREAHTLLASMKRKSLWPGDGDPGPYNAMARAHDTCMRCQNALRANDHVRFLREQVANA